MADDEPTQSPGGDDGRPSLRRAMGEAVDAALGRVGEAAGNVAGNVAGNIAGGTARSVVDEIEPYLTEEYLPRILEALKPYLSEDLVPEIVDAVTPHINEAVAPQILQALMPRIRTEVVPLILDDFVDDPRVRDLIREQSQGLILDAVEEVRSTLASADDVVEGALRRLARRPERGVEPPFPVPSGRNFAAAGMMSRFAAAALDIGLAWFVAAQGLTAVLSILSAFFGELPPGGVALLTLISGSVGSLYFGLAWWLTGQTLGGLLLGTRVRRRDGRELGPIRAFARAIAGLTLLPIWAGGLVVGVFLPHRRSLIDHVFGTRVEYRVHDSVAGTRASADVP